MTVPQSPTPAFADFEGALIPPSQSSKLDEILERFGRVVIGSVHSVDDYVDDAKAEAHAQILALIEEVIGPDIQLYSKGNKFTGKLTDVKKSLNKQYQAINSEKNAQRLRKDVL